MKHNRKKLLASLGLLLLTACIPIQSTNPTTILNTPLPPEGSPTLPFTGTPPPTEKPTPEPTPTASPTSDRDSDSGQLIWVSPSADLYNRVVTFNPSNKDRIAYCTTQEIRVSSDGGQSWNSIPTSGVADTAEEQGYLIFDNDPSLSIACMSVTLDSQFPNSFYAVFTTAHEEYGAPPVFYMGFITQDNGSTWQLAPPPDEATFEEFGGFWTNGDGRVEALFSKPRELIEPTSPVYVQETSDGGNTWNSGALQCPTYGLCLRWGPSVSNIPGMGSPLPQEVLLSLDRGQTWEFIEPPAELRAPPPNQLVSFSENAAAIISGSITLSISEPEPQQLRLTQDGGLTWEGIPLPPLPDQESEPAYYPGLQILPNRNLISQSSAGNDWLFLPDIKGEWCPISAKNLPDLPVLLQAIGDQLWWVDAETGLADTLPISEISCAGS